MKNIIKMIGLVTLIGFSFFYTDKVIEVIREEDEIMIELESMKDIYQIAPTNATIAANTIIPGQKGRTINIEESYKKMKNIGLFDESLIIYDDLIPEISLTNNKDKFIIKGNNNKQMVSLIFILKSNKYLDEIEKILDTKEVSANYFVDYDYLIDNSTKIKSMSNREFYSYGKNGTYASDNLLFSNNLISRITNNEAIYCISTEMDTEILNLCQNNNLYTITPTIIGTSSPYNSIKENLTSGSIILLSMNGETAKCLGTTIDYIKGKGYQIDLLSTLLSEEL